MLKLYINELDTFNAFGIYIKDDGLTIGSPEWDDKGIDVPGRNGKLHILERFWGNTYGNREISIVLHGRYERFHPLREIFIKKYHGTENKFMFSNDDNVYWKGYSTVEVQEDPHYCTVSIKVSCDPFPYDYLTNEVVDYVQD